MFGEHTSATRFQNMVKEIILKIQISNKSTEEEYINRLKIFNDLLYKKYDI